MPTRNRAIEGVVSRRVSVGHAALTLQRDAELFDLPIKLEQEMMGSGHRKNIRWRFIARIYCNAHLIILMAFHQRALCAIAPSSCLCLFRSGCMRSPPNSFIIASACAKVIPNQIATCALNDIPRFADGGVMGDASPAPMFGNHR